SKGQHQRRRPRPRRPRPRPKLREPWEKETSQSGSRGHWSIAGQSNTSLRVNKRVGAHASFTFHVALLHDASLAVLVCALAARDWFAHLKRSWSWPERRPSQPFALRQPHAWCQIGHRCAWRCGSAENTIERRGASESRGPPLDWTGLCGD